MKKIYLLFTLVMAMPLLAFSQDAKFMGLDLGGSVDTFCKALKTKGLKQTIDRFDKKEFVGTFATYNDCRIIVYATEASKKVKMVEVVFESVKDDEYDRDKAFKEIVEQYKNKYKDRVVREPYDKSSEALSIDAYIVKCGDIEIDIRKMGPNFLSPNKCSMYVTYKSKSLCALKEVDENKFSNDI